MGFARCSRAAVVRTGRVHEFGRRRVCLAGDLRTATTIRSLATGDFNGDGHLDIVAAAGDSLAVYFNAGDGTFGDPLLVYVSEPGRTDWQSLTSTPTSG